MKSLEEFQNELIRTMQALGRDPSAEQVEAAGRELVKDGVPDGANLEGLLLLEGRARLKASRSKKEPNDDPETGTGKARRPG